MTEQELVAVMPEPKVKKHWHSNCNVNGFQGIFQLYRKNRKRDFKIRRSQQSEILFYCWNFCVLKHHLSFHNVNFFNDQTSLLPRTLEGKKRQQNRDNCLFRCPDSESLSLAHLRNTFGSKPLDRPLNSRFRLAFLSPPRFPDTPPPPINTFSLAAWNTSLKWRVKGFHVCTNMKRADEFPQFSSHTWLQNNRTLSKGANPPGGQSAKRWPRTRDYKRCLPARPLWRTGWSALTLTRRGAVRRLPRWAGGESERLSGSGKIWGAAEYKPLPLGWRLGRMRVLGFLFGLAVQRFINVLELEDYLLPEWRRVRGRTISHRGQLSLEHIMVMQDFNTIEFFI